MEDDREGKWGGEGGGVLADGRVNMVWWCRV
jgi:hypothetical protein